MPPATRLGDLCIDGDTVIPLLDGTKQKIKDLVGQKDFYVYSIDLKTKEIVPGLVEKVWLTGYSECLKITLDNNETLIVTPDHKMIDINGKFVKAKDLKINQSLMPFYRKYQSMGNKTKYEMIKSNKGWIYTHRMVYDFKYGGLLDINNTTHHKDLNPLNNEPKNILACNQLTHFRLHAHLNSTILKEQAILGLHPLQKEDVILNNKKRMIENNPMKDKNTRNKKIETEKNNNGGVHPIVKRNYENNPMKDKKNIDKMVSKRKEHPLGYHYGYTMTEETKYKLKNRKITEDTKQKLSQLAKERANLYKTIEIKKKRVKSRKAKQLGFQNWDELLQHIIKRTQTEEFDFVLKDMNLIGWDQKDRWKNYIEEDYPINHKVIKIEVLHDIRPVYNMTVSDTHTYALDIGIFIKNCTGHSP